MSVMQIQKCYTDRNPLTGLRHIDGFRLTERNAVSVFYVAMGCAGNTAFILSSLLAVSLVP